MKIKRKLCIFIVASIAPFPILLDIEHGEDGSER